MAETSKLHGRALGINPTIEPFDKSDVDASLARFSPVRTTAGQKSCDVETISDATTPEFLPQTSASSQPHRLAPGVPPDPPTVSLACGDSLETAFRAGCETQWAKAL